MSHLDDLDEFEAELELSLKREYSAVFSLFRYCVLTQDATYLCNKLDLEALPQVSYPFFHVRMEDVWVWDKNRPSRIIPKAEVYTSGDVTVEELRVEGEEPRLTAEALAERIGQPLSGTTTALVASLRTTLALREPLREPSGRRSRYLAEKAVERGHLVPGLEHAEVELTLRIADVLLTFAGSPPMPRSRCTACGRSGRRMWTCPRGRRGPVLAVSAR